MSNLVKVFSWHWMHLIFHASALTTLFFAFALNSLLLLLILILYYYFYYFYYHYYYHYYYCSYSHCYYDFIVVIVICFGLFKLVTMSPSGWHPPYIVDNVITIHMRDQLGKYTMLGSLDEPPKSFLCLCMCAYLSVSLSLWPSMSMFSAISI